MLFSCLFLQLGHSSNLVTSFHLFLIDFLFMQGVEAIEGGSGGGGGGCLEVVKSY